jgi:hypothetical protein
MHYVKAMKGSLKILITNRFFGIGVLVSLCMNGALWLYLSERILPQVQQIPLHYNIYFGIDLVGPWWYLFAFPVTALGVFLVNTTGVIYFFQRERAVSYFFLLTTVAVHALFFFVLSLTLSNIT